VALCYQMSTKALKMVTLAIDRRASFLPHRSRSVPAFGYTAEPYSQLKKFAVDSFPVLDRGETTLASPRINKLRPRIIPLFKQFKLAYDTVNATSVTINTGLLDGIEIMT